MSPDYNNTCTETHPNAIIRVQRLRDTATHGACTNTDRTLVQTAQDTFWPNVLYDPREGMLRDDVAARPLAPHRQRHHAGDVTSTTSGSSSAA